MAETKNDNGLLGVVDLVEDEVVAEYEFVNASSLNCALRLRDWMTARITLEIIHEFQQLAQPALKTGFRCALLEQVKELRVERFVKLRGVKDANFTD